MNEPLATLQLRVDLDGRAEPGTIAVLLDLLKGARVIATWRVPPSTDPELVDRLFFDGHATVVEEPAKMSSASRGSDEAPDLADDPLSWLHHAQLSIGRALEHKSAWELRIDPAALDRSDSLSAVAEALDLVAGLVRADRLRVVIRRERA